MTGIPSKKITLLGATGSIGGSTLDVVRQHPEHFSLRYLSAHRNVDKLVQIAREFRPEAVILTDPSAAKAAEEKLKSVCKVLSGEDGLQEALTEPEIDLVINAMVGGVGVKPTHTAIQAGKDVALANKETLVEAGQIIMAEAKKQDTRIFPIDSEHSAIWQCLLSEDPNTVRRIILTASGGPFRTWPKSKLEEVTVEQALQHPNWQMGAKITIDSATLMNKGLEVIEAFWLYSLESSQIDVIIHPQSIIHSMVEFCDGSVKAQLGVPDMRIPIQYALTWPNRLPLQVESLSFAQIDQLTFEPPDFDKFPCLRLAFDALRRGGTAPAVMNSANETAVQRFLQNEIKYVEIPAVIEKCLETHSYQKSYDLQTLFELQQWTREHAAGY